MPDTLSQTRREDLSTKEGGSAEEPALYVVLEGERAQAGGMRIPLANVDELRFGRGVTRTFRLEGDKKATLEIPDPRMSGKHARLVREDGAWLVEDTGSTNGTFVEGKRTPQALVEETTVITLGATVFYFDPTEQVPDGVKSVVVDSASLKSRPRGTATLVPIVEQAMPRLVRVAMSKLSVLLLGESGAGKEVLAQTIHKLSGRAGPFIAINCGALTDSLVESQLFGHLKGSFSGALKDEPGLVRASSGGTLFLDEIGELPPAAQATLLRVLQEKEVLPVGGTKPVPVDLRVVAATLKPIDESSQFRSDLYARVAAFVHRLVPLRERRGDLGLVIQDILPRVAGDRAANVRFAPDLGTAIVQHPFPLNFRELEHILSVALVTSTEDLLRLERNGDALKRSRAPDAPEKDRPTTREQTAAPARVGSAVPKPLGDEDVKLKDGARRRADEDEGQHQRNQPRDGQDAHANPPLDEALRPRPRNVQGVTHIPYGPVVTDEFTPRYHSPSWHCSQMPSASEPHRSLPRRFRRASARSSPRRCRAMRSATGTRRPCCRRRRRHPSPAAAAAVLSTGAVEGSGPETGADDAPHDDGTKMSGFPQVFLNDQQKSLQAFELLSSTTISMWPYCLLKPYWPCFHTMIAPFGSEFRERSLRCTRPIVFSATGSSSPRRAN